MKRVLRLKAIVPLVIVLGLVTVAWSLVVDRVVELSVERIGTLLVGARVDLAEADLRIREGSIILRGLEVTNPDRPMTNLFVADEIVADLALRPLLEKKVVIDTIAVRGVRFGTARATSGALEQPSESSEEARGLVAQWADQLRVPPLSFEGLGSAVDVGALSPDSLRSLREARAALDRAQQSTGEWESALADLDPRPRIDSARSLVAQLRNFNPLRLGPSGIVNLANNARTSLADLESLRPGLEALDSTTRVGVAALQASVLALDVARNADYAYARGLMQLPSLDAPDLSTSIFGDAVVQWVRPVMYWAQIAERFVPPGLDPRNRPGPKRARLAGTDVSFPGRSQFPQFLVRHGEIELELGGEGGAAGGYAAVIRGLTTEPAVYGRPTEISVARTQGRRGPTSVTASAMLDHVESPGSDSLAFSGDGITLPTFELAPLGARLVLGQGSTQLSLRRDGPEFTARMGWNATSVRWETMRATPAPSAAPAIGTRAWVEDLLWRTVSSLQQVRIDVELGGTMSAPTIGITSNVGDAISQALQRELGREIQRAERRLRAEVDAMVDDEIRRARSVVGSLTEGMVQRVGIPLTELDDVEAQLRREIERRIP